jgi:TatD DNase family protein
MLPSFDPDDQHRVFVEQLKCASRLHRPVSIHCRKAWGVLIDLLTSCGGLKNGGTIHSYSGSADLIKPLERLGCSFSLSGSITYDRHTRARRALMALPLDKLLLETDAPDIPPEGHAGPNVPRNIVHILPVVARLRAIPVELLAERIYSHSFSLFGCK